MPQMHKKTPAAPFVDPCKLITPVILNYAIFIYLLPPRFLETGFEKRKVCVYFWWSEGGRGSLDEEDGGKGYENEG